MPYKNKQKQKEYLKVWASNNRKPKSKQTSWLKRKEIVKTAKDKPCAACGIKYDPIVMDLHHINPEEKDMNVSRILRKGSYQKLQEEIDKCIVLCANCHRMIHGGIIKL